MKKFVLAILFIFLTFGCAQKPETEYIKSIKKFHNQRIERLKKPNSWLSLVGLYWLKEGKNTFGSDETCDLVFPKNLNTPNLGAFILQDSVVSVEIYNNKKVYCNDTIVTSQILNNDLTENTSILKYGSLSWFVVKRGDKYGIRLKDSESPLLKEFSDIEMFEIDSTWKIPAEFIEYETAKEVLTPTAIGAFEKSIVLGYLAFTIGDQFFTVEPSVEEDGYFLVFGDKSNGEETYGAGRFLYIKKPNSNEQLFIDFNKAYNPPCVFTKYATCPLPRKENNLNIKILAGEKNFHSQYH